MPSRRSLAALSLSAAALLAGCTSLPLAGPIPLDGSRPEKLDEEKLVLRPGMVLYVATPTWGPTLDPPFLKAFSPGSVDLDIPLAVGGRQPQLAGFLRVPIREVDPASHLTDEELLFLGTILSLQRLAYFGSTTPADPSDVQEPWRRALTEPGDRAALWTALIDSLALQRHPVVGGRAVMFLRLTPSRFCQALDRSGRKALAALARAGLFKEGCSGDEGDYVEAFALGNPPGDEYDPLAAMTAKGDRNPIAETDIAGRTLNQYFLGAPQFAPASFVRAEIGGIRLREPGRSESQWSLAEWESSKICSGTIDSVSFPGSPLRFRIVPDQDDPSAHSDRPNHKVVEAWRDGAPTRTLALLDDKGKEVPDGKPGRLILDARLARSDLARLNARDITHIRWSGGPSGRHAVDCGK